MKLIEKKESQIIYFGWASCPNCQAAIRYIDIVARNLGFKKIYYYDIRDIRKEDGIQYHNLIEKLAYENSNKLPSGVSRMPAPTVFVRKNQSTLSWVTREYFIDEKIGDLAENDKNELIGALTDLYNLLKK